jgi:hypothetical protein
MPPTKTSKTRTSEIAIFGRLIRADDGDLSRELARYILTLGFGEEDQAYALTGRRCREMASRLPAQFTNRKGSCG